MQASKVGDTRALMLGVRQALIIALGALEDYAGMPRSIEPKHKRQEREQEGREAAVK